MTDEMTPNAPDAIRLSRFGALGCGSVILVIAALVVWWLMR